MKSIDEKPVVDSVVHKCGSSQRGQFKDADGMPSQFKAIFISILEMSHGSGSKFLFKTFSATPDRIRATRTEKWCWSLTHSTLAEHQLYWARIPTYGRLYWCDPSHWGILNEDTYWTTWFIYPTCLTCFTQYTWFTQFTSSTHLTCFVWFVWFTCFILLCLIRLIEDSGRSGRKKPFPIFQICRFIFV